MFRALGLATTALITIPTLVAAGGIERSPPSTRVLFEEGRYVELSFSLVGPDVDGTGGLLDPTGSGTGELLEGFANYGAAYKADIGKGLSYAFIFDTPYGSDTLYPTVATSGYSGTSSDLDAFQLSAILAYDINERVKVYGGARLQSIEATAFFPFFGLLGTPPAPGITYDVDGNRDYSLGYMFGAAYQIPDIAGRVALTYYSAIDHDLDTTENIVGPPTLSNTEVETPQSINLEFQSGIAQNTLLFGSVRWVEWSEFAISPAAFTGAVGAPLVAYADDTFTYTLGLGHRFNENWSGAVQVTYEPATDAIPFTTLGPVDGFTSIGLAATYTMDNLEITGGITYADLGETQNFAGTVFDDGDAFGIGVRLGYSF
jgi:long-subunit fatty acid transport protein